MGQRPSELSPHRSAQHFLGAEMRQWRTSRRLSLAKLSTLVRFDSSYLGRAERGEQLPSADVVAAYDRELGASGSLVRLRQLIEQGVDISRGSAADEAKPAAHEANYDDSRAELAVHGALSEGAGEISIPVVHDGKVIYVRLSRRAFLGAMGATAALAAASPIAGVLPASATPTRLSSDVDPVEHFMQMRRVLIDNDNLFGPHAVIPTVEQQIQVIHQVRQGVGEVDRRRLLEIQTQYAEMCSWLYQDAGSFRESQYWSDRALEWSHSVGNHDLTVYILARKAQLAADIGDGVHAVDFGSAARSAARPYSKLPAIAATYAAHGYALQGDPAAAQRTYDLAHDLLTQAEPDPDFPWASWLDPAYIEVHRARSHDVLGQHQQAANGFEVAIQALPTGFHRDRGVYLAQAATAQAGLREFEHAAATAMEALSVGANTRSGRITTELTRLDERLAPWRTVQSVNDFHDALTSTSAANL